MLKIDLIKRTQDFFNNYVVDDVNDGAFTVVAPSPQLADLVRARFDSVGKQVNAITISKFIKDELNSLFEPEDLAGFRGKSELILLLGAIWKKIGGAKDFIAFQRAFSLLTEFRSFSISDQVLESVLENYDETIAEQVLLQQRFLNELDLVDEHRSYYMLSERLRAGDLPVNYEDERNIIFYGFDYLTALQVDLIKSISLRCEVSIPFYKEAYEHASNLDWIKWFGDHECEVRNIAEDFAFNNSLKTHSYSKNYFGKMIKNLSKKESDFDILLGTKKLTREFLQEIPISDMKFKVGVDLFQAEFNFIYNQLEEMFDDEDLNSDELREILNEHSVKLINQERFREIKVITLFLQKIEEWESLSSENTELGLFDLSILKESILLDLPRINLSSFNSKSTCNLYSIADLEKVKNKNVYFCLNSNYGALQGGGAVHSENVEKYLASIGPIRRVELELEVLKCKMKEFFSDNNVEIITESGLIDHDTTLNKIFSNLKLENAEAVPEDLVEKSFLDIDIENVEVNSMSASKLQKYIECPRKYYHQYISKFNPSVSLNSELTPLELGQIEHKVIEDFFKQNLELSDEILSRLINEVMAPYFLEKIIERKADYLLEVKAYTFSCIEWLLGLKESIPELNLQFEYPLNLTNEVKILGSVDLFAQCDGTTILIDFKRSNHIFKSFTSVEEFKQIQLWFYLTKLIDMDAIKTGDIITGYIDLSKLENSMFFTSTKELAKAYKPLLAPAKIKAIEEFEDTLSAYSELESKYITALLSDRDFLPMPRDKESCTYCSVSNICSRGLNGNT